MAGRKLSPVQRADPEGPPVRPKSKGKRAEPQQWIPDRSLDRTPPTFAQIYLAVRDAQFNSIFDGDLKRLELSELQTLDRLTARQFEFYRQLAKQQQSDPDFEPPAGVPDLVYQNAAIEMRTFKEGRLATAVALSERRQKTPELIEPWAQLVWDRYDEPFGMAFEIALPAAKMVIEAEVKGQAFQFSDEGIARYGYLDKTGAQDLLEAAYPADLTKDDAPAYVRDMVLAKMRSRNTILPREIATAYLTAGSGKVEDSGPFLAVIARIRNDMLHAIEHIHQKREGTALFIPERPAPPANLIYKEFERRASVAANVYEPFAGYLAAGS